MNFDFEKIKQNLSSGKLKEALSKRGINTPAALDKGLKSDKFIAFQSSLQQGWMDMKVVLQEGKFSLFVKQIVVLAVVFLLVQRGYKNLAAHKDKIKDDTEALQIQQVNKSDYAANKQHLLRLEPLFPDISQKREWMLVRLSDVFEKHKIQANIDGNPNENSQGSYVVASQQVAFTESFKRVGELLAEIENGDDFLRVSDFVLTKRTEQDLLGTNSVDVRFNTVFPNQKYAATLFKDYAQQMEQISKEQQATEKIVAQDAVPSAAASTENQAE